MSTLSIQTKTGNCEWPELVGVDVEMAKKVIEESNPHLEIQVFPEGSIVTQDYRLNRVRIFVTEENKVSSTPRCG